MLLIKIDQTHISNFVTHEKNLIFPTQLNDPPNIIEYKKTATGNSGGS